MLIPPLGWRKIHLNQSSIVSNRSCTLDTYLTPQSWPWQSTRYVTLKITNSGAEEKKAAEDELQISQHIAGLRSEHEGRAYVRLVQDWFQIQGILGDHLCLVFEPLREPIWLLGRHLGSKGVPPQVLKAFLRVILCGLDFLHSECHVMHTGK